MSISPEEKTEFEGLSIKKSVDEASNQELARWQQLVGKYPELQSIYDEMERAQDSLHKVFPVMDQMLEERFIELSILEGEKLAKPEESKEKQNLLKKFPHLQELVSGAGEKASDILMSEDSELAFDQKLPDQSEIGPNWWGQLLRRWTMPLAAGLAVAFIVLRDQKPTSINLKTTLYQVAGSGDAPFSLVPNKMDSGIVSKAKAKAKEALIKNLQAAIVYNKSNFSISTENIELGGETKIVPVFHFSLETRKDLKVPFTGWLVEYRSGENAVPLSLSKFSNGKANGPCFIWHEDGNLSLSENYSNGFSTGDLLVFHKNGNVKTWVNYSENGVLISSKNYIASGQEMVHVPKPTSDKTEVITFSIPGQEDHAIMSSFVSLIRTNAIID